MRRPFLAGSLLVGWFVYAVATSAVTKAEAPPAAGCPAIVSPLVLSVSGSVGGMVFDQNCAYLYLSNATLNRVEVYSLQGQTFETPIQVGAQPAGMDISPDGSTLYVTNSGGNNISVVDLAGRTELRRISVTDPSGYVLPYMIAIAGNGKALFVTSKSGTTGSRIKSLELATDNVAARTDWTGFLSDKIFVTASGDRSVVAVLSGSDFSVYRASMDLFSSIKKMGVTPRDVGVDLSGHTFLVAPQSLVNDDTIRTTGTVIGGSGLGGTAVDPTRGLGYRAVGSGIDVLNLSTFLQVRQLPLGGSVSSAAFGNTIGRMAISGDGSLLAVITNTGVSLVRPLEQAPELVNLIRNGSFSDGTFRWFSYATPDPSFVDSNVSDGVFRFNRIAAPGGTTNQALVFHETGMPVPAGTPLDARFDLGNSSSVRKRISVLLVESDFSDISVCTFWVPPNTPLTQYRMRSHTTKAWSNAAIYFYAATAGADGGFNLVDNVSLQLNSSYAGDRTECVDPFAPAAGTDLDGADMLTNGDFSTGDTTGWAIFGTMTPQVSNGVFQFMRESSTPPAGVILQSTGQPLAASEVLTATFDLGNTSAVRKRVTVLLHDLDFSDLSACTFWLAPGQPLASFTMRAYATRPWTNTTLSFYAATTDSQPWTLLDNVHLRRTPAASITGAECIEPADWSGSSAPVPAQSVNTAVQRQGTPGEGSMIPAVSPVTTAPAGPPAAAGSTAPKPYSPPVAVGVSTELVDLTGAIEARLLLDSRLDGVAGEVQVSPDGVNWFSVADIAPSDDWSAVTVDLNIWTGRSVLLRLVLLGDSAKFAGWAVGNMRLVIER